ncbi:hypothetical protein D9M71_500860 [compost metagenome]
MMTFTLAPACDSLLTSATALYTAIPPETQSKIFLFMLGVVLSNDKLPKKDSLGAFGILYN